jgi:hypothetical protein
MEEQGLPRIPSERFETFSLVRLVLCPVLISIGSSVERWSWRAISYCRRGNGIEPPGTQRP